MYYSEYGYQDNLVSDSKILKDVLFYTQEGTFTKMHTSTSFSAFEKGSYLVCKHGRKLTACYQNKSHSAEKGQIEVNPIT